MAPPRFRFELLPEPLAICRLDASAPVPSWADAPPFCSIVRTAAELSVVCAERHVPPAVRSVTGRRALGIRGTVDFATVGVISSLTSPLAEAGISVFIVSTFDTDWLLVTDPDLGRTVRILRDLGHEVA